jgi:molybdopterin synthase catalytic subunit/molybdopterin synthase sulfur carrier subunit
MSAPRTATVRVLAFAGARDAIGAAEIELPWAEVLDFARAAAAAGDAGRAAGPPTADDLLALACVRWPRLAPFRGCLRVAVNGAYAAPVDAVGAGDEVALIPPVAGG